MRLSLFIMMQQVRYLLGIILLGAAVAGGWTVYSKAPQSDRSGLLTVQDGEGSGILDGMSFSGKLGMAGEPGDIDDRLVFRDGLFVSTECDRRCGYPAQPYYTRRIGDRIEFVSEAHCLHKDATLVWRGVVEEDVISGTLTWTLNRWYWTLEKEFWFEGTLTESLAPVADS